MTMPSPEQIKAVEVAELEMYLADMIKGVDRLIKSLSRTSHKYGRMIHLSNKFKEQVQEFERDIKVD